jgi:ElaB/YqjD/DUF883 family membrane-anchored ribosome-binding protein
MSRRPLLNLISGNSDSERGGSAPPSIDPKALDRLDHTKAEMRVPRPDRVENLPVRTATQAQQDTSNDVQTETKSGVAESGSEAGWYEVTFDEPFAEGTRPSVTASCEERKGEFEEGDFRSPEHGSPQGDRPDVADISLGDISIAGIDIGSYEVGSFSVSPSSVSSRSISDRSVDERGISERSIDTQGISSFEDVFKNFSLGEFEAEDANIEFGEDDVGEPDFQSFEERLKQRSRNLGKEQFERDKQKVRNTVPNIIGSSEIEDFAIEFSDHYSRTIYGYGDEPNQSGEGALESIFGTLGVILDETVRQWILDKAQEELLLADKSEQGVKSQKEKIVTAVDNVERDIVDQVNNKIVTQINDRLNKLKDNSDNAIGYLGRNADTEVKNLSQEVNEVLSDFASQVDTEFSGLSSDINSQIDEIVAEVNTSFEANTEEMNAALQGMADSVNEVNQSQTEDINANITGLRDSTEDNLATLRDDTEANMTELRDSIEKALEQVIDSAVNQNLSDYNSNVQQSYGELGTMSQEALNQSPRLLYDSIGAPEGQLITPVQVRNVDNEGFEFLGYEGGMTINWMAMGVTQESDDTEQTEPEEPPDSGGGSGDGNGEDNGGNGSNGGNGEGGTEDPTPRPPVDTPILDRIIGGSN